MSVALLDVNLLIALLDENHNHHEAAHRWLSHNRREGWATCPITINGCVRILSNPKYPNLDTTASEVVDRLREMMSSTHHRFWPDSVSLTDDSHFRRSDLLGSNSITDVYLLGLAVRNHGRLATFDRNIPLAAVHGATARHLEIVKTL